MTGYKRSTYAITDGTNAGYYVTFTQTEAERTFMSEFYPDHVISHHRIERLHTEPYERLIPVLSDGTELTVEQERA